ncbi:copper chaperone for superoxide dismutase [Apiospora kogelbergensis]|uniref:copper chaperone for superoxide dismutase n=1 Tax=Apiospora kogelbergensis TaxID=1337665 RepID=UPI00312E27AC
MTATNQKVKAPFQTLFNVHMTCDDCIKAVSDSLYSLDGVTKVDADLKEQLVTVEGTATYLRGDDFSQSLIYSSRTAAAPSAIVSAIEATGRDAILRGSGAPNSSLLTLSSRLSKFLGSAVCILETFHDDDGKAEVTTEDGKQREVRGLARMVQVSPDTTLVDLTLHGVDAGKYTATIRAYGDLSDGAATTGPIWAGGSGTTQARGLLGSLEIGKDGKGAVFLDHPFQVWEVIGHSMVVSRQDANQGLQNDENTVVGVIARSAGMWENLKQVCSCSGKDPLGRKSRRSRQGHDLSLL